jgi:anti-sigma28 factor (negative regulator of flagellin synthesis)
MASESFTSGREQRDVSKSNALRAPSGNSRILASAKGAATLQRHREERRADSLSQIRAQIADGTLVVRQMTADEHRSAAQAASLTLGRTTARRELSRAIRASQSGRA